MSRRKKIDAVEIDTRLAAVLGLGRKEFKDRDGEWVEWWERDGKEVCGGNFSPATKRDHFAEYVLPEIEGRGMWTDFEQRLYAVQFVDQQPRGHERPTLRWFAKAPPLTLAAAALAVLEGKP